MADLERLRRMVKEQREAEDDGGYAAGDAPYYDSEALAAAMQIVDAAEAFTRLGFPPFAADANSEGVRAWRALDAAVRAARDVSQKERK